MGVNPFNFDRKVFANAPHSVHNMSYDIKFTCNVGEAIPCYVQEVFPGDRINYHNAFIVKSLPLVTPTMMDIYAYCHYWYVPYRILQSHETIQKGLDTNTFEDYISGIHEGLTIPLNAEGTRWNLDTPTSSEVTTGNFAYCKVPIASGKHNGLGGLLDYLGQCCPYEKDNSAVPPQFVPQFAVRAYNAIYNVGYRNSDIQNDQYDPSTGSGYGFDDGITNGISLKNCNILRRNWLKDYFTSMLPWQQKGTPIALPVSSALTVGPNNQSGIAAGEVYAGSTGGASAGVFANLTGSSQSGTVRPLSIASTAFDINDLRLSNAVQRFLEKNAIGGTTYHKFCLSHFGVAPRDETLDRPLYLGGSKTPVIISEVTQTSSSDLAGSSPQGTLTGKAQAMDSKWIFKDRFDEHGIVMGIFSLMPDPTYSCNVNRMWIKTDVYDWYFPEFAHLGEQPIYNQELNILHSVNDALKVKGFQGRWSEMRTRQNMAVSDFVVGTAASTGNYGGLEDWTIQRNGTDMALNSSFIVCRPNMKMFAFPNSRNFVVDFGNVAKMSRPVPALADPMLVG